MRQLKTKTTFQGSIRCSAITTTVSITYGTCHVGHSVSHRQINASELGWSGAIHEYVICTDFPCA